MKYALVVDDEYLNREVIRLYLEELFYEVIEASNGEEAVAIFEKSPQKFNLITMDYNMPRMDGVEAINYIRNQNQKIPIIGISAAAQIMHRQLKKPHNIRVLRKPLDKAEFELVIKELALE